MNYKIKYLIQNNIKINLLIIMMKKIKIIKNK